MRYFDNIYTRIYGLKSLKIQYLSCIIAKYFLLLLSLTFSSLFAYPALAERVEYIVYDGQAYAPNQLESAASSPTLANAPYSSGNDYVIPRASDGHYYVAGSVNGFPVVFMVDTGASISVLPAKFARNSGIRAGRVMLIETAAGRSRASAAQGNILQIGPYKLTDAKVGINDRLDTPLLGMDALNRFQITQSNGMMILRANR